MGQRKKPETGAPAAGRRDWSLWLLLALLVAATFAAYHPAWHGGVLWDDDDHLTRLELQGTDGLYRIWFDVGATLQHYPLLHTAFWIEHRLFGDAMTGYHLVNIGMHGLAAVLLFIVLRRLAVPGALFAAAIFALHPVQVESVAWITELKNTMSTVLLLGAALLYFRFDRTRGAADYALAAVVFGLALLTKTVTGTLPIALLIVLWWQRGRLNLRRDVLPLVPLAVAGIGAGLVTAWWEREFNRTTMSEFELTMVERVLVAGRAIVFHLSTLAWPANLTFSYPRWQIDAAAWWQYLFPLGVGAALAGLWFIRGWSRAPLAGFVFFCVALGPTLGFFNLYTFRYSFVADHYQYVACIGIIALVAGGLARLADRRSVGTAVRFAAALAMLAPLAVVTWHQSHQYVDRDALYAATIARNPSSWLAHVNLGNDLQRRSRLTEAISHYQAALALAPESFEAHQNLGLALQKTGRFDEALAEMQTAVRIRPDAPEGHLGMGICWRSLNRPDDAAAEFREAIRLRPDYAEAHLHLASTLEAQGRVEESTGAFREAVRFGSALADAHYRFANALMRLDRKDEAIAEYRLATAIDPAVAEYHNNLGFALEHSGRLAEALAAYTEALRLRPTSAFIENNLGSVLIRLGRFDDAIEHLRRSLQLDPEHKPARDNLALAISRRGG